MMEEFNTLLNFLTAIGTSIIVVELAIALNILFG